MSWSSMEVDVVVLLRFILMFSRDNLPSKLFCQPSQEGGIEKQKTKGYNGKNYVFIKKNQDGSVKYLAQSG